MSTFERIRSGLPGLDSMLDSIRMGDNVVWQVSSMDDYMHFVTPLCNQLHEEGKELLYMHFPDTLLFFIHCSRLTNILSTSNSPSMELIPVNLYLTCYSADRFRSAQEEMP